LPGKFRQGFLSHFTIRKNRVRASRDSPNPKSTSRANPRKPKNQTSSFKGRGSSEHTSRIS
jgi:hypothetical protein